jgi:hypothetical protein
MEAENKTTLTAEQARAIAEARKKNLDEIMFSVSAMAESGQRYAMFRLNDIMEPETIKEQLVELGYNINVDDIFFEITW